MPLSEFDIITQYFSAIGPQRDDVRVGIGDDAAIVALPRDTELVLAVDTLVVGRHFPDDTAPADIGFKALAVNLSDLAAMGAVPAWFTLALSLPEAEAGWLQAFAQGLAALAGRFGVQLVGGDTTRGPLTVSVTVAGYVARDAGLRRAGAQPGERIFVSGTLGDAAYALTQQQSGRQVPAVLRGRLDRPEPRLMLGRALQGIASACIDISDGFAADLGHLLRASQCGARINLDALPASETLCAARPEATQRLPLLLTGGDDYELCFCVPPDRVSQLYKVSAELNCPVTEVGEVLPTPGLQLRYDDGTEYTLAVAGYDHFRQDSA